MSGKKFTFAIAKGFKINSNTNINSKLKYNLNMEIISNTIQTTLNSFDFSFCIIVNIITYLIVNVINNINKNKDISTWSKRSILIISIIILGIIYYLIGNDIKLIINSSILAPVFWSWVIKPICSHFNLDYKQLNLFD